MLKNIKTQKIYIIPLVYVMMFLCACRQNNIQAGQVWIKSYYVDNPYRQVETDTLYILDVKGEYMKYRIGNMIESDNTCMLMYNAKLISNGN